jgi:excisionase family DNA binding protein
MKACEVVGVSRRTIYNWMAGGKIEFVRTAGGSVRIFADSLWRSPEPAGVDSRESTGEGRGSTVDSHGTNEIKH